MSWINALMILMDCPAILRVGARTVCLIAEAIDEGRDMLAQERLEIALCARRGEAAGRAAKASSDATRKVKP